VLGGFRSFENTFNHLGYAANIWSSTENDSENGYNLTLYADNNDVAMLANLKTSGFSVRCVED